MAKRGSGATVEDRLEAKFEEGTRMAYLDLLSHALRGLGRSGPEWNATRLLLERERAVIALRRLCAEHGDNDWPDDLNLGDVIDKHLDWEEDG